MRSCLGGVAGGRPAFAAGALGGGAGDPPASTSWARSYPLAAPRGPMASNFKGRDAGKTSSAVQRGRRHEVPVGADSGARRLTPTGANNIVPAPAHMRRDDANREGASQHSDAAEIGSAAVASEAGQLEAGAERGGTAAAEVAAEQGTSCGSSSRSPANLQSNRPSGQLDGLHRPVGLVVGSAWLLATSVQLAGRSVDCCPWRSGAEPALVCVPLCGLTGAGAWS